MILSKYIRKGMVGGQEYTFTHWDPKTNSFWTDDVQDGRFWGVWIKGDKIKWQYDKGTPRMNG